MIRLFRHSISTNAFILALLEFCLLTFFVYQNFETLLLAGEGHYFLICVSFSILIILVFMSLGLYNRDITTNQKIMAIRFLFAIGLLLIVATCINKIVFHMTGGMLYYPSWVLMLRVFIVGFFLFLIRMIYVQTIALRFLRKILVIGAGRMAERLNELFENPSMHGIKFVGFIGVKDENVGMPAFMSLARDDFKLEKLAELFRQFRAEEIVFAPDDKRGISLEAFLHLKLKGYKIYDFQSFVEQEKGRIEVEHLNMSGFVFTDGFSFGFVHDVLKRAFDLIIASLIFMITLPVIIMAIICIKIESKGPALFSQERVGFEGKPFQLYKLRSMNVDAEKKSGPKWAAENDDRITRIGRILRKTRIDELPQLWNVIKGDMSFVGPRPERPVFVSDLAKKIPYYQERHVVKPGITGWAQINYPYGASLEDAKEKLCYDLYYAKNRSLFLDLTILLQTVRVVLWPTGVR